MANIFGISFLDFIVRIFFSVLVGSAIGIEREHKNRPAGMRTHILVCFGSTLIALLECMLKSELSASPASGITMTVGRLSAQVISGIGFLGAGTIFTAQKKITGLTTAASLWNVACLGLLIGFGYYVAAVAGCAIILAVLLLFQKIFHVNTIKKVEIKFTDRKETIGFIENYFSQKGIQVLDLDFHVEAEAGADQKKVYNNLYTLHLPDKFSYADLAKDLMDYSSIQSIRTRDT